MTETQAKPVSSTKTSFSYQLLTTIFALTSKFLLKSVSIGWIFFSKHHLNKMLKKQLFSKNQLVTLDDTVDLFADLGFYAAIYLIVSTFTVMIIRILNNSVNPAISQPLEPAEKINELIRSFTQSLIIFGCLFLYFLENSTSNFSFYKESAKKNSGFLLPIWFMSGYIAFWFGNLFELLFKRELGFNKAGFIIEMVVFVVLLGEINGFKLFKLI